MKRIFAVVLLIAMLLTTACTPNSETLFEAATNCIGKTTEELREAVGLPNRINYASSCLGNGMDGELTYDGFTVYTYLDVDGTETVYDVVKADSGAVTATE